MIEDILENYRRLCTRKGQFDIALNPGLFLIIVFCFGGMLGLFIYIKLENYALDIIRIYLSLGSLFLIEIIYLFIIQLYIFKKEQKSIIKELNSLIEKELNKSIKEEANKKLFEIKKIQFQKKYFFKPNPIEKIFDEIKFEEFLEISHINNSKKAKKSIEKIDKYLKDQNYFKEYIDVAFFGVLTIAVLNPIIEYIKSIFIPNTATEFNFANVILFFFSIAPFIVLPIFTNHIMHKINYSKNINEKRILFKLAEKLSNYDFNIDKLERYNNIEIDD